MEILRKLHLQCTKFYYWHETHLDRSFVEKRLMSGLSPFLKMSGAE